MDTRTAGRRATDAERYLDQLTRELARMERDNDLWRTMYTASQLEVTTLRLQVQRQAVELEKLNALVCETQCANK